MHINFTKIFQYCLLLSVILLPITSLSIELFYKMLRGLSQEAAFYPLGIWFLIWIYYKSYYNNKIYIPRDISFNLLLSFLGVVLLSGIINAQDIAINFFRGIHGYNRFITLFLGICFCVAIIIFIYDSFYKDVDLLERFHKACIISFCIASFYSFFELGWIAGVSWMTDVLHFMDRIIRSDNHSIYLYKIRSICLEPSAFGIYSSFILPWIFTSICLYKKTFLSILLNIYFLILVFLSVSRSSYIIFAIQGILFFVFFRKVILNELSLNTLNNGKVLFSIVGILISICFCYKESLGYEVNILEIYASILSLESESNLARYGAQIAAVNMFLENPFFGVGLGQYMYYAGDYMPNWAWMSSEIRSVPMNTIGIYLLPLTHGLYARILGELGINGLIIWVAIWGRIVFKLMKISKDNIRIKNLIITLIGTIFYGFIHDSFATFNYWILFGISLVVINQYSKKLF